MLNHPLRALPSIAITATLLFGCSGSDTIRYVKDGSLDDCPDVTLGQMADSYMDQPYWESFEADDGLDYVNLIGGVTYNGMPVEAIIQFRVYENTGRFEYYALEVDGQSMNNYMAYSLLDEMCTEAYTMY